MNSVMFLYNPVMTIHSLPKGVNPESHIFIVFFVGAIGSIMGGTMTGKLSEVYPRINIAYGMLCFVLLGNTFSMLRYLYNLSHFSFIYQNFYIACAAGFLFGFSDSSCSSLGLTILTKDISKTNHAFASFNLC